MSIERPPESVASVDWRTVFEQAPVALSIVHPDGTPIAQNEAYRTLFGLDPTRVGGVADITWPEDQGWSDAYRQRLAAGEAEAFSTAKRFRRADGSELHGRLDAVPLRDRDGNLTGVMGAMTPIEVRDRIEDARLREFLAHSEATFMVVDEHGSIIETSGRYQTVLGYPPAFWEARTVFDLVEPDELEMAKQFQDDVLSSPGQERSQEFRVRAADGSSATLLVQAVNLLDEPDIRGLMLTSVDVTERRRIEAGLRARSDTAEAVAEAQRLLLATVSHELRNPLHAVQGLAELLASEELPARAAELAASLTRQLAGLASVTEDLLDAARLDAGTVELRPAATDLRLMVAEVLDYGRVLAGAKRLSVIGSISDDTPAMVTTDPSRLRQILRNVVGNAVKFTASGVIRVDVRAAADQVRIAIHDSGVGIPQQELAAILQPFRTGSTAGVHRGAGLGLAIVQRLVAALGGTLEIASTVGFGTIVSVMVPLVAVASEPLGLDSKDSIESLQESARDRSRSAVTSAADAGAGAGDRRTVEMTGVAAAAAATLAGRAGAFTSGPAVSAAGRADASAFATPDQPVDAGALLGGAPRRLRSTDVPTVLVVEDNAVNQDLARHQLERLGMQAVIVESGEAALALLAGPDGDAIDVVLMDHLLPGIDGVETTRRMRALNGPPSDLPVVCLTASASAASRAMFLDNDMDAFVSKPATMEDIRSAIERALMARRERTVLDTGALLALEHELGDRSAVEGLVATFLATLPDRATNLVSLVEANDVAAPDAAHGLRGGAQLLGALEVVETCRRIEAGNGVAPGTLRAAFSRASAALSAWHGEAKAAATPDGTAPAATGSPAPQAAR